MSGWLPHMRSLGMTNYGQTDLRVTARRSMWSSVWQPQGRIISISLELGSKLTSTLGWSTLNLQWHIQPSESALQTLLIYVISVLWTNTWVIAKSLNLQILLYIPQWKSTTLQLEKVTERLIDFCFTIKHVFNNLAECSALHKSSNTLILFTVCSILMASDGRTPSVNSLLGIAKPFLMCA